MPATFQVLSSHMRLVPTEFNSRDIKSQKVLLVSTALDLYLDHNLQLLVP